MTMPYETNWKKHIDPDFDSAIRTFLFYIRGLIKDTDSGYFAVKDEVLQTILKSQGWQASYDGNEWLKLVHEITGMKDEAIFGISISHNVKDGKKPNADESLRNLLILSDGLSDISNKYYHDKIDALTDGTYKKSLLRMHGKEKEKAINKHKKTRVKIVLSLALRSIFKDKLNSENGPIENSPFKSPTVLNNFMCGLFSLYSQAVYRKSIHELLQKNDDVSLLKAVTVDKSLISTEKFKLRIMQAQLSGDGKFLEKLGHAIADKPLRIIKSDFETFIILKLFWLSGLDNLSHEDLYQFLKSCGIKTPPEIPYAMEQFLKRHIHPIYKNWMSGPALQKIALADKM